MPGGSLKLFRVAGITVYLHLTWFLVAWYQIESGRHRFVHWSWAALEYVALFFIVLLHEFGHAFACRSVGGRADRIVLWPLGGLAFVDPPLRPGAVLWSIVAGPMVNVLIYPILHVLVIMTASGGALNVSPDAHRACVDLWFINIILLLFNLLPFYPLDGGQIVRALLWFRLGPIRSLMIAGIVGVVGAATFGLWAIVRGSIWTGIIAFFLFTQASAAITRARAMAAQTVPTENQAPPGAPPYPPRP